MGILLKKINPNKKEYFIKNLNISDHFNKNKNDIYIDIYNNKKKNLKRTENILFYFDNIIKILHKELNLINKTNFSKSFWRLLIGPWLIKFIEFYYDKYLIIKHLPKNKKIFIEISNNEFFLENYHEIWTKYLNEDYINNTYFEISKNLKLKDIKYVNVKKQYDELLTPVSEKIKIKNKIKKKIRNCIYSITKKNKYSKKIININLPLNPEELDAISDKNNNLKDTLINTLPTAKIKLNQYDANLRNNIIANKNKNEFVRLVCKVLMKKIPSEYLENFNLNYKYYHRYVKKNYSDIILVRSPLEQSLTIRYFLAISYEMNSSKIFGFQEGGNGKLIHQIHYEKYNKIGCSNYVQWSNRKTLSTTKNFFCTKTFWIKKYDINYNQKILIVLGSMRKSFFSYFEGNLPNFSISQIEILNKFLDVSKYKKSDITLRFHKDFGFGEQNYFKKNFPNINQSKRESRNYHFYEILKNFSLKIFTSDYTANVQSMIINHPTIMLWDDKIISNNKNYDDLYKKLYLNKILFYDPIKCSKFVNDLIDKNSLFDWWFKENTQRAKNEYLNVVCRLSNNFESSFLKLIN